MKIRGVDFRIQPSSNHASPTGSLPFLIVEPAQTSRVSARQLARVVPASKLAQWIEDNAAGSVNQTSSDSPDYRAFSSLIDKNIRDAWLYAMYVDTTNLNKITIPKYTHSTPFWPVKYFLGLQMRQAALDSLGINNTESSKVTGEMLYMRANEAWAALSTLLGDGKWFFGASDAGLFDASVFAFTHLILTLDLGGSGEDLVHGLRKYSNLVNHQQRIRDRWCT
ncbi:Metaxin-3 [Arthrobotrys entomopaga]|nr:Metaxin-3 [Arthrobotrys entomopaga]